MHSRAGLQLREDCAAIVRAQGRAESAGGAKITSAYNLPCRYVLHTVGPRVALRVGETERNLLKSCYLSCLDLAREKGLKSVAFCCISTGVFNFPAGEAAEIAVGTAKAMVDEACRLSHAGDLRRIYRARRGYLYRDPSIDVNGVAVYGSSRPGGS
ncbi:MAG: macro domain-containing protein [Christensenellaceae bacterium]